MDTIVALLSVAITLCLIHFATVHRDMFFYCIFPELTFTVGYIVAGWLGRRD